MYLRTMLSALISLSKQYRVISVMGPRQSGKTTLVKEAFSAKPYVNLEIPDQRYAAQADPRGFLAQFPEGAILDEIQHVPELLSYIQAIVDEAQIPGQFIITGSHQLELHEAVSQSLAGRVGLLSLYPLTQQELKQAGIELSLDEQIIHGFYPGVYSENQNPTQAYRFYVQTYLEKDVRQISAIHNLMLFQNFMKLCAGRIGQTIDYAAMSNEIGVAANTVKNWISILEASYIIVRLKPYFENFGKRLIKAPKLYFTDVGLAAYLLDIQMPSHVSRDPLRGYLVENLAIMELVKYRQNRGMEPNIYYYRDNLQKEVDIVIKHGHQLIPVEIKSSQTFSSSFLSGLMYFTDLVGERVNQSYVVYAGELTQTIGKVQVINYKDINDIYRNIEKSD